MSKKFTTFKTAPPDFSHELQAGGVVVEQNNKILLVQRHPEKSYALTWGIPAGKIDKGESIKEGSIREIQEEVGLTLDPEKVSFLGSFFCRIFKEEGGVLWDYTFHVFHTLLEENPTLSLKEDENIQAEWVSLEESFLLSLIHGGREVLEIYKESTETK